MGATEQGPFARVFYGFAALGLVAGAIYGLFSAIKSSPVVGGSIVTALGAVGAVVAARYYERQQQVEQARRERISGSYEKLISTFIDAVEKGDAGAVEAMREVIKGILLWGSQDVVVAINAWRETASGPPADPRQALLAMETIVRAMRSDVGSKSETLSEGDLLRTFLNDFDQLEIEFETSER